MINCILWCVYHMLAYQNRTLAMRGCYYATAKFETTKCPSCADLRGSGCIVFRLVKNLLTAAGITLRYNSYAVLRDENLDNFFYYLTLLLF